MCLFIVFRALTYGIWTWKSWFFSGVSFMCSVILSATHTEYNTGMCVWERGRGRLLWLQYELWLGEEKMFQHTHWLCVYVLLHWFVLLNDVQKRNKAYKQEGGDWVLERDRVRSGNMSVLTLWNEACLLWLAFVESAYSVVYRTSSMQTHMKVVWSCTAGKLFLSSFLCGFSAFSHWMYVHCGCGMLKVDV